MPVLARALGLPTVLGDPLPAFQVARRVHETGFAALALELAATMGVALGAKR